MLRVPFRIPVILQKPVAMWLLGVAGLSLIFGVIFIGIYSVTTKTTGMLWWKKTTEIPLSERRPYLILAICLFAVAILCAVAAIRLFSMQGTLKKYLAILTGVESMKVQQIADITNSSTSKVYRDIQAMIDCEMVRDFYIDHSAGQVVSKKYIPKRSYKTVVTCPGCGDNNELIVGITRHCSSCGQPLVLKAP
jgi:hypothetical protein